MDTFEKERSNALSKLAQAQHGKEVWDFVDFAYFSCVTMTTLGYGDIVPNSRSARMAVMAQAWLGVSYIAFALSFLWPRPSNAST
jgi:Ion channel